MALKLTGPAGPAGETGVLPDPLDRAPRHRHLRHRLDLRLTTARLALLALAAAAAIVGALRFSRPGTVAAAAAPDSVLPAMERILRRDGLAAALDSLDRRAAGDTALARDGHQLVHALGRDAVLLHGGDPSIIRQCTSAFASGCYHGVVEAALHGAGRIDMPALERLCVGLADSAGPGPGFECIHGLGHGVLGVRADLAAALRDCDALSTPRRVASCHMGAFMEAVNRSLGSGAFGAAGPHAGMHHGAGAPLAIDARDPYSPCRAFGDPYADSCWLFQSFLILRGNQFDAGRALAVCDGAPDGRADRCYYGVGHQLTGLFQRGDAWVVAQCARGQAALAPQCAAGATFALDAMDWTGGRAARFCATAPTNWKADCYRAAADALVDLAAPAARESFCEAVEPAWATVCRDAAELSRRQARNVPDGRVRAG